MFDFGPSSSLMQKLRMTNPSMNPGISPDMSGGTDILGGMGMPGMANSTPPPMMSMMGRSTMPTMPDTGIQNTHRPGIFSRMMSPHGNSGNPPTGNFGAGGKMTGALAGAAPSFGNMLLDDEARKKQMLRSF